MSKWALQLNTRPLSITLKSLVSSPILPLPQEDTASKIEIAGLEAVVLVSFTVNKILSAKALFPTRMAFPSHPRGYLHTAMHFETSLSHSQTRYDGSSISFFGDNPVTLTIFVSPSQPIVYSTFTYSNPQVNNEQLRKMSTVNLPSQGNFNLYRHHVWISPRCQQVMHTCLSSSPMSIAFADLALRKNLVREWTAPVSLSCPDEAVSTMLHFAKIRVLESMFKPSNLGLVHSPGGNMFYSGVWTNDQAEYASPALALLGPQKSRARQAAINSVAALGKYFDYKSESVPYSVEVDGGYIGRLDRGDPAMFAWGVSLLALVMNDEEATKQLLPLIYFACGLLYKALTKSGKGIIPSASDELEGRFPTGEENLSTNCLAILAFRAASHLASENKDALLRDQYRSAASTLEQNTHRHFSCPDERIYAYYKGCPDARGWACLAALAGLQEGKQAVEYCLNNLWCDEGVLTSSANAVVWDRTTLYAIRAAYRCGMVDVATEKLHLYAERRLKSRPAAPFAVENNESWAQLSAESALFVRIITEGILGMDFLSNRRLLLTPRCPSAWPGYAVEKVHYAEVCLTFRVQADDDALIVKVESVHGDCETIYRSGRLLLYVPSPPLGPDLTHLTLQECNALQRS